MTDLKQCPFCGAKAQYDEVFLDDCEIYQVACSNAESCVMNCFTSSHYKNVAIDTWNTRATDPDTVTIKRSELETIKKDLSEVRSYYYDDGAFSCSKRSMTILETALGEKK